MISLQTAYRNRLREKKTKLDLLNTIILIAEAINVKKRGHTWMREKYPSIAIRKHHENLFVLHHTLQNG